MTRAMEKKTANKKSDLMYQTIKKTGSRKMA
jgi:hypothetical protein